MIYNSTKNQTFKSPKTQAMLSHYHTPHLSPNQCGSSLIQTIDAPLPLVWSMVRRFDNRQGYKQFIRNCNLLLGDGGIGSIREVMVISGLPAGISLERLDNLDDDMYVMKFSIIGGDHQLANYCCTTTLHQDEEENGDEKTVVIESYVVDIPAGSSQEDTCSFANTIVGCNLKSLTRITEEMACKVKD
ncbi:Abscisic acid receptor like [Quillaja saponaria]|uniref:Abscisic acid receptor like n=1 Tax=Quillaja saponaria TaxID=32244 RepID=A0AAD7KW99_QUISA|nr:Abscisic acid receptor like [Quillaja saponaria]